MKKTKLSFILWMVIISSCKEVQPEKINQTPIPQLYCVSPSPSETIPSSSATPPNLSECTNITGYVYTNKNELSFKDKNLPDNLENYSKDEIPIEGVEINYSDERNSYGMVFSDKNGKFTLPKDKINSDTKLSLMKDGYHRLGYLYGSELKEVNSFYYGLPALSQDEISSKHINYDEYTFRGNQFESAHPKYFKKNTESGTGYFVIRNLVDLELAKAELDKVYISNFFNHVNETTFTELMKKPISNKKYMLVLFAGDHEVFGMNYSGVSINYIAETENNLILNSHAREFGKINDSNLCPIPTPTSSPNIIRGDFFAVEYTVYILPYTDKKVRFNFYNKFSFGE